VVCYIFYWATSFLIFFFSRFKCFSPISNHSGFFIKYDDIVSYNNIYWKKVLAKWISLVSFMKKTRLFCKHVSTAFYFNWKIKSSFHAFSFQCWKKEKKKKRRIKNKKEIKIFANLVRSQLIAAVVFLFRLRFFPFFFFFLFLKRVNDPTISCKFREGKKKISRFFNDARDSRNLLDQKKCVVWFKIFPSVELIDYRKIIKNFHPH